MRQDCKLNLNKTQNFTHRTLESKSIMVSFCAEDFSIKYTGVLLLMT